MPRSLDDKGLVGLVGVDPYTMNALAVAVDDELAAVLVAEHGPGDAVGENTFADLLVRGHVAGLDGDGIGASVSPGPRHGHGVAWSSCGRVGKGEVSPLRKRFGRSPLATTESNGYSSRQRPFFDVRCGKVVCARVLKATRYGAVPVWRTAYSSVPEGRNS
jgi:hypothetical protein